MSAPTLHTPTRRPGLWPVVVGALMLFGSIIPSPSGESNAPAVFVGAVLLAWGVRRRWINPKRAAERDQAERAAFLGDPARQARLAAWRDGTAFAGAADDEIVYQTPCTWYSPTPSGVVKERDSGEVQLTPKMLRLSGESRSQEVRLKLLRGLTAKRDGVVVERSNGPHIIVAVSDPEELVVAIDAVRERAV